MTIHYHGADMPAEALMRLRGRCFCVTFMSTRKRDTELCHEIGQSVMLDNGAFSVWRSGRSPDWPGYYEWAGRWLDCPTTWAVIPDVIDGDGAANDALIDEWPHGRRGSPVWHLHEPLDRLLRLVDVWPRVCFGSSREFAEVGSASWHARVTGAWNALTRRHSRTPWIHMLRGMQAVRWGYPFASVDSTDIARNRTRPQNSPEKMADRWDAGQCPVRWAMRPEQHGLDFAA